MAYYLVTGAAGFIGARVCQFLLTEGQAVIGVDNLNDAYDVRLKQWRLARLEGQPGFEFHALDVTDREALRDLFQKIAAGHGQSIKTGSAGDRPGPAVINLAARAGVRQSVENPQVYFETNITGALNLLELCREYGVKKFLQASTSSLYGQDNPMPYREDQNTDHPLSPYAASKKSAESLCYTYHYLYGIDIIIFRFFTVYGPAGRPDMSLFRFTQWISEERPVLVFGDGRQSRDFTYVDDIAQGVLAGLKVSGYEVINLGSDTPVVLIEAIRLIEKLVGKKARLEYQPRHSADILATWADIDKARRLLAWRPTYSFEKGVRNLVAWYTDNVDWAREIVTR